MKTNPATRKRVNLSLGAELFDQLNFFAKNSEIPLASKALDYIKKGIEEEEDQYLSILAETRYEEWKGSGEKTISAKDLWEKHTPSNTSKR